MSNPNGLFLLADHIKLSLLERKRARALNLQSDSQDGHISRSLDQFRSGIDALLTEQKRLEEAGDDAKASAIAESLSSLAPQLDDLTAQFHGFSSPSDTSASTQPNDGTPADDCAHADPARTRPIPTASSTLHPAAKPSLRTATSGDDSHGGGGGGGGGAGASKTVRFQDTGAEAAAQLFNQPYRDEPAAAAAAAAVAVAVADENDNDNDNVQLHAHHSHILREQDAHLDRLGESISRQRELSMQIGDELDDHIALLDDQDRLVDRHRGRLDRARRHVGRFARSARESKQIVTILVLIFILFFLFVVLV